MKKRIYVNIMFKPKIWGLYFTSLFSILGGFVICLMVLSLIAGMVPSLLLNTGLFGGLAGYLVHRENRDEIESSAKRSRNLKGRISSHSISDQRIRLGA